MHAKLAIGLCHVVLLAIPTETRMLRKSNHVIIVLPELHTQALFRETFDDNFALDGERHFVCERCGL